MPALRDKAFDRLTTAVEAQVAWNQGAGHEWQGHALMDADFLGDLVRLAFEAPKEERDEFIAKYGAED